MCIKQQNYFDFIKSGCESSELTSPNHNKQNPHQLQDHNSNSDQGANMELLHKQGEFREKYTENTEKCREKLRNFYVNDQKKYSVRNPKWGFTHH